MRLLLALLGTVAIPASAQPVDHLVGQIYSPLPGGWASTSGALLGGIDSPYSVSAHVNTFDDHQLLTFDRLVTYIEERIPIWVVLDAEDIGPLPSEEHYVALLSCYRGETADEEIIAVVRWTRTEWLTDVHAAWRANRATERLEPLDPAGIRCVNEGDD